MKFDIFSISFVVESDSSAAVESSSREVCSSSCFTALREEGSNVGPRRLWKGRRKGNEIHFLTGDISELLYRTVLCELHHNFAIQDIRASTREHQTSVGPNRNNFIIAHTHAHTLHDKESTRWFLRCIDRWGEAYVCT